MTSLLHSPSASLQLIGTSKKRAQDLLRHCCVCDCHQGTPPDHLALLTNMVYAHESHRSVTNGEQVLNQLQLPGHSKKQHTQDPSLSEKEAY